MRPLYSNNTTVFGAPATDPETNKAILIRVKNAGELARSQGTLATIAQSLAPATIEAKVYDAMRDKLAENFKAQHVDADVTIVEPKGFQPADGKHFVQDIAIGLGIVGALAIAYKLVTSSPHKAGGK